MSLFKCLHTCVSSLRLWGIPHEGACVGVLHAGVLVSQGILREMCMYNKCTLLIKHTVTETIKISTIHKFSLQFDLFIIID